MGGIVSEFMEFLNQYKVMGLAVAFIIGGATTVLVQSLVNNVIMPIIGIALPNGAWQTATVNVGPAVIVWGAFASALINFLILLGVVFLIAKFILKEEKPSKR
ncbi:MAG: MscL family protein [Candidatus Micrarchaeota archaeon]|nr:MscL family protein [Candidatus Micrarchaeota archaeon]